MDVQDTAGLEVSGQRDFPLPLFLAGESATSAPYLCAGGMEISLSVGDYPLRGRSEEQRADARARARENNDGQAFS
jgi:hypothetical protein